MTSQSGNYADANPFRFSTKYFDAETGLSYYGYRYYSARLGRWLSRDPIGEAGGVNLYGFVLNSPPNFFEALGLFPDGLGDEFDKCIADLKNQRIRRQAALQDMCAPFDHAAAACQGAVEGACQGGVDVAIGAKDAAVEVGAIAVDTVALAVVNDCYQKQGVLIPYEPLSNYCQSLDEAGDRCFEVGAEAGTQVVKNGLTCGVWGLAEGLNRVNVDDPSSVQQFCRQQGGGALLSLALLRASQGSTGARAGCDDAATTGRLCELTVDDIQHARRAPLGVQLKIPRRLSNCEMERLTGSASGDEFAQIYVCGSGRNGGGGQYHLIRGNNGEVPIPIGSDVRLICHTHPRGTPFPSPDDLELLQRLREAGSPQRCSTILPLGKSPVRFTESGGCGGGN
ncbi:MAG: RHS repeat-associated core domain-containing protein [Phycisphaerae bacterium]